MMKTKNIKWIALSIFILGAIIMVVVAISSHPFFRSPKRIINDTLSFTPMGTYIDDVAMLVKNQTIIKNVEEWRTPTISYEWGYVSPGAPVPGWTSTPTSFGSSIVGYKSVMAYYKTHYNMYISVFWGFDEEGKLIDVFVTKNWDMIPFGEARRTGKVK